MTGRHCHPPPIRRDAFIRAISPRKALGNNKSEVPGTFLGDYKLFIARHDNPDFVVTFKCAYPATIYTITSNCL